ncbi:hypothetical protein F5883DRAFT_656864 [Diaporthe sp. PMI_573]|nr:hypothetical protein F5883DRAFT_656864 [Diaporthaceae sp. PMI_573]
MAERTTIAFGAGNSGSQVGLNNGTITNEFHVPPEPLEAPPKPSCTIPFGRDPDFIDRETLLDQIHRTCSRPASRAALVGLGGVGKSQLAIEYCYRTSEAAIQKNTHLWVFWIHAETRARIEEDFKKVAEAVKLPGRKDPKADIPQLMEQWLCNVENGPWLLVLDNADDDNVLFDADHDYIHTRNTTANTGRGRALWTYLPQSPNGSILITSRNKTVARRLTGDYKNMVEVPLMDKNHALALLARKVGSQPDMDHGAELVEVLENMPLAISQAGAYIQQRAPRTSISKYLEEFRRSERRKFSLLNRDEGDLRRDSNAFNSVIITWQISFESIRSERPSAADLLSLMSFFDRQGIPDWLVRSPHNVVNQDSITNESAGDVSKDSESEDDDDSDVSSASDASEYSAAQTFEDDLAILRNYCLISLNKTGDVFEMHNLVQLATRKWLSVDDRTENFKEQFVSRIAREFPTGDYSNWATCETLFAHVEKAFNHRPIGGKPLEEWARVLYNGSWYAHGQGRYSLAELMAKKSRDARMETLGDEHELTLDSVSMVGKVFHEQGKYEKAEKLFVEVMETRKQKLGPAHPDTLTSMANLASTFCNQGRWVEAEKLFVEVIETSKQKLGPAHPDMLTIIANLASTFWNQGRWEEAEKLEVEVMETRKQKLGLDHPDTLTSMANLASTFRNQGRWEEAEELEVEVMETSKQKLGPTHPDTLTSIANLASTFWNQGRWEEAEELEVEVIETSKQKLGPDHPNTLTSMANLASTFRNQGRWEEAEKLEVEVIETFKQKLGPSHPSTLSSIANLALTFWNQGRWEEAEKLEVEVMETRKQKLGPDHPNTLTSMANLAFAWYSQGRTTDAIALIDSCVQIRRDVLGTEHPDTSSSIETLDTWRAEQIIPPLTALDLSDDV